MIAPTAALLSAQKDHFFRTIPYTAEASAFAAQYIYQEERRDTVALLYDMKNNAYAKAFSDGFKEAYISQGGQIGLTIKYYSDKNPNWKDIIQRINDSGIKFVAFYSDDLPDPSFQQLKVRFNNRFGKNANFAAAFSYDAIQALAVVIEQNKGSIKGFETMLPDLEINGSMGTFS